VLALASCEQAHGTPSPRPASVIADFTRGSRHATDGVRAFVGAVSAMTLDEDHVLSLVTARLGLVKLDGIDRDAPLHLLVVDGKPAELVLLAKVADAAKLETGKTPHVTIETRDGWAAIGRDAQAVHAVAPYALSALVDQPPADQPTLV